MYIHIFTYVYTLKNDIVKVSMVAKKELHQYAWQYTK